MRTYCMMVALLAGPWLGAAPGDFTQLNPEAERWYAEKSFAKAHEWYAREMARSNITSNEARWVFFRNADTLWRSQAATATADTTQLDQAHQWLEQILRETARAEEHDRIWAETQESLADYFWTRRNSQDWGQAFPHYQAALDWWAGARDLELARTRYLAMIWRMARPEVASREYYYGYWGNFVPVEILENALKIATTDTDRAHAHYLVAMTRRNQGGDLEQRARVNEEFEAALKAGRTNEWYDDALFNYALWLATQGRMILTADGTPVFEPDYIRALELFRRLVSEYAKGETRYWEQAQQQIKQITDPVLNVSVANIFLPDSEIQYQLNWRNVKSIELALYPVELNRDVKLGERSQNWLHSINPAGLEKIKSWTFDPRRGGGKTGPAPSAGEDYKPGNASLHLEGKLKPGAYLLVAGGGPINARELILVTDTALVVKHSGRQALLYFCNALEGSPVSGGRVKLWQQWWENNGWHVKEQTKDTGPDGIAVFDLEPHDNNSQIFASAIRADRQAFSASNDYYGRGTPEAWRIYAFTDRPAYRPQETVNWKFIGRHFNGSVYAIPGDQTIQFEITDPRGTKVKEDKIKLNSFGSAWGMLELTAAMPLGEYRVQFFDEGRRREIGSATLFRLEEYKLPEFKVVVSTPEEAGRKKAFRLGDQVQVEVQADYYFGGPVANANVEILVRQTPFYPDWHEPREFSWLYPDAPEPNLRWRRNYGGGAIIKQETVKTDAHGRASLSFATPRGAAEDYEYRIEVRVTDSSRREITGSGNVRVTRQRYYVHAQAAHNLYRPQDKASVKFKALDANDQPVPTAGTVRVTRDYWWEIWLAPDGHEVKGDELKSLREKAAIWPPGPSAPNAPNWRLKFRGYQHDDILTRAVNTDTNGAAEFAFTPEREGYYRVAWTSEDEIAKRNQQVANPIQAETTVWVCSGKTTELGYRNNGVQIIADQDTFRVGNEAPIMLVSPTADRYVLFTVEGEDLQHYQLVHLEGTVKLIDLRIEEQHTPNIFLGAALVSDRQLFLDSKEIMVPPTKNFLTVTVQPDRPQYQPREAGTLTVTTHDDAGKPVSAEVALSLVDESVFYIQGDYAADPRQFFFGTKRDQRVQTTSTMNQRAYARLVVWDDDQLLEEREAGRQRLRRDRSEAEFKDLQTDGDVSGFGGNREYASDKKFKGVYDVLAQSATLMSRVSLADGLGAPALGQLSAAAGRAAEANGKFPETPPGEPAVQVRSDFRSTIFWQPDVKTDASGRAVVKIKYPDSLTGWKATARAVSLGNQLGMAATNTQTKQPLIVRLQAPRFFVVGDTVTLSAVINNNTEAPLSVQTRLELPALGPAAALALRPGQTGELVVPAHGEARVDWVADVKQPGEVKLKVTSRGGQFSDAMEKTYPSYPHGIEKFLAKSGKTRGNDFTVKLDLPVARQPGTTMLTVQITPSLAVTMLDALPYLIDYPYGCTEQTMSRFLPAIITAKTLREVGLQPEDVMSRVFGGIETNTAAATHPKGKKDLAELEAITKAGLERLYDFQHGDGGWSWWKEGDSDHWMTAYVVWGLALARDAGVKIKEDVLTRGRDYLAKSIVEEETNPDQQSWMLHALAVCYAPQLDQLTSTAIPKAFDNLWTQRESLNAYTRALLALSAHHLKYADKAKILIQNLENGVKRDDRPDASVLVSGSPQNAGVVGTAHWGEDGVYWRWSDGGVEATAFALRALLAIDPRNPLVEPVTNWLLKNRRGAQWNNTRDTALVVLAMNDYLRVSGELKPEGGYEVFVNGKSMAKSNLNAADVFQAPALIPVDPKVIGDHNEIRVRRTGGTAPLYFAVAAKFFSTEEPVTAAGSELFVKREYYKLVGRPTLLKGYVYEPEPLHDGDSVASGERVQTRLVIETKNNYEYLLLEDLKPAGLEAAELRSGESRYARELKSGAVQRQFGNPKPNAVKSRGAPEEKPAAAGPAARGVRSGFAPPRRPPPAGDDSDFTGRQQWVYQELRDRKVALFVDHLPEGVWEIRYDLRAEVPGRFHALPVLGQAMYVPEIRANGDELRVNVQEAQP